MQSRLLKYTDEAWAWEDEAPRGGVHISAILQGLRASMARGTPKGRGGRVGDEDEREGYINAGNAFDLAIGRALDRALCDMTPPDTDRGVVTFRPKSKCIDGIWGSADRLVIDNGKQWRFPKKMGPCPSPKLVEEHKLTWMKFEDDIEHEKFWFWLVQDMAYCYMHGTCRGRIRALFVNGDYRPPRPIDPVAWDLVYTVPELWDNWEMLRQFAKEQRWLKQTKSGLWMPTGKVA